MDVLRNMVDAVRPGGLVLDLQVIRPDPVVEVGRDRLCEIDGSALFESADAAAAAVDALIGRGRLLEEAADDHDVRKHYPDGADLIDDFAGKKRQLPPGAPPHLRELTQPCAVREQCRVRRLKVSADAAARALRDRLELATSRGDQSRSRSLAS